MSTKIRECKCKSEYQDKRYGPRNRVMNKRGRGRSGTADRGWRCTVCKAEYIN